MFKKTFDTNYQDFYEKFYKYDGDINDAMDKIVYSGLSFTNVEVSDIGDVGMKYFGGKYSYEDFIKIYEKVKFDIASLSLYFEETNSIHLSTVRETIILLSKNPDTDLNKLLEKKNKQL